MVNVHSLQADSQEHAHGAGGSVEDPTFDQGISEEADISSFLERPVRIYSGSWGPGTPFAATFNPWQEFITNTAVLNKLANYKLLRGNLMLTFYINGTPQHAGMLCAAYSYLGRTGEIITIGGDTQLVTTTQRPHIYLDPGLSRGGNMCLPFFWKNSFIDLQSGDYDLGTIRIDQFQNLTQLNAGTDPVQITVFAHMTDVVLTGMTGEAIATMGNRGAPKKNKSKKVKVTINDEYKQDGPVSSVANAVAQAADSLSNVPVIGPFARATEIGASAVGKIAALFGFSRPAEIADSKFMRNTPLHSMANSDGSDTCEKLTMTKKQELTIDPRTVGLKEYDDPLNIMKIAQIETYFHQISISPAIPANTDVQFVAVSPNQIRTSGSFVIPTALHYVTIPFERWSGSLRFRFKIVASQFTRGKLAIAFDPSGSFGIGDYNMNPITFIDLNETRDVTIEIPWSQAVAYKELKDNGGEWWDSGSWSNDQYTNGVFVIKVVNPIVQPDGVTPIYINMFISAGDDFEVANPIDTVEHIAFATSGKEEAPGASIVHDSEDAPEQTENVVNITTLTSVREDKPLVFYGERVESIRQLIKRYCFYKCYNVSPNGTLASPLMHGRASLFQLPTFRWVPSSSAHTNVSSTFIHYAIAPFAAWRGGTRRKFLPMKGVVSLGINRFVGYTLTATDLTLTAVDMTNTSDLYNSMSTVCTGSSSGCAYTPCVSMNALEVELPYANNYRYSKVKYAPSSFESDAYSHGYVSELVYIVDSADAGGIIEFVAAAEDFQVFGFTGCPPFLHV